MAKKGRRRGKIRIKKSVALVHKSDATRVSKPDTTRYPKMPLKTLIPDNGATFKIKLRKRN